ncbi:MAG: surface carbohydrate biosynthesis protein [Dissulfuribacterales bacterium]
MATSASPLIIPVETQIREMDAKLLLACLAAEHGFPVVIGSRAFIHFMAASVPRGVYLAKSMRTLSIRMFNILKKLGHEIIAWDEEGLLREADPEYYRWRLSPVTMQQISHLIAWGHDDAQTFRNYPGYNGAPIHIAGNPRVDLLRPELREFYRPEVDAIHKRFGEFVLINTNFSKVNHFYPKLSELKKAIAKEGTDAANQFDIGKGRHKLALFTHFQKFLPPLCESLAGFNVVVRPHPAENQGPWHAIAERYDNLHVANDGNVIPWLMAAKALIANGCTTQVESAILGTPTVNYQPVRAEEFDFELPALVSRCVFSLDELCSTISDIVKGKLGPLDYAQRRKGLDRHITALDGDFAAERIIRVLETGGYKKAQPPTSPLSSYAHGWIQNHLRTIVKRINMHRPGHRNNIAYHTHRFPDISVAEIMEKIEKMGTLLNRFKSIRVKEISKHIFTVNG